MLPRRPLSWRQTLIGPIQHRAIRQLPPPFQQGASALARPIQAFWPPFATRPVDVTAALNVSRLQITMRAPVSDQHIHTPVRWRLAEG